MEPEEDASQGDGGEVLCYCQRVEKSTGGEITLMQWSPTMDLLAAALADNSVVLNRLSWQRVWSITTLDCPVTAMAWRPDGRVLAVGRKDGSVCLHSVEDGHTIHELSTGTAVTSLQWTLQSEGSIPATSVEYLDKSQTFLPPLPALDISLGCQVTDPKQLKTLPAKQMNMLVIGDAIGRMHLCVSGIFLIVSMEANTQQQDGGHMIFTCISHDLKLVLAFKLDEQSNGVKLQVCTLKTSLVSARSLELQHLALKFGQVGSLLEYMSATLKSMHEAWEDVLLMMDTKLATYSSTLPEGRSVSDELMVLLACGKARPELQTFLVDELTAKGVKKMGLSLEMSYSSIRKYAVNHLNSAVQSLQYHLGEVLGMARWYDRFGVLGLSEAAIQGCINLLGTFALKCQELLVAIDDSLQSIKVVFQWLYVVIQKMSGELVPKGLNEHLSPEELKLVIEFLKKRLTKVSMATEMEGESQTFNLEIVGQYLTDEDLKYIEERPPSLWEKIQLEANLTPGSIPWLFQPDPKKSLVQLFHLLHRSVDAAFAMPMASIRESFSHELELELGTFKMRDGSLAKTARTIQSLVGEFVSDGSHCVYFPVEEHHMVVLKYGGAEDSLQVAKFHISDVSSLTDKDGPRDCEFLSLQGYSSEALSVLFQYPTNDNLPSQAVAQLPTEVLATLPWETTMSHDIISTVSRIQSVDVGPSLTQVLSLGPFKARSIAVTGSRRLAAVLTASGKKVRLYDVDAEGEEEEED